MFLTICTADGTSMEELLKSQLIQQASVNPINRKHKPHLLEVSAAQQRQTDALSRDKNSPMKTNPNMVVEVEESNKLSRNLFTILNLHFKNDNNHLACKAVLGL